MRTLLLDDLYYLRTLIFMQRVYYNASCVVMSDMFTRCYNVHQVNTRSHLVNFDLNHTVSRVQKSFIVFSGTFLCEGISKKLNSLQLFKSKIIDDVVYRCI